MTFAELNIKPETLRALQAMGVEDPTPIQQEATPKLLEGRDVVGQAKTGSGKTLAFSIPLVELCDPNQAAVQAMVLVPTRELAFQVGSVIEELSKGHKVRCAFLYGGRDVSDQQTLLASGPQVVIGTPGRVLDLLYRGNLRVNELRFLVIDEADEMFDEGFGPDVDQIFDCILHKPQVALFSATVPAWVDSIAAHKLADPVTVRVDPGARPAETVEHRVIEVADNRKLDALKSFLREPGITSVVFCRTKDGVERLAGQLNTAGLDVASLRGNMTQPERERVMRAFRRGHPSTLVATNVAARGLDIAHIGRVINYDLPDSVELLTHRLGRTGRMGRSGEAMTFVTPRDRKRWDLMQSRLEAHVVRDIWSPSGGSSGKPSSVDLTEKACGQETHRKSGTRATGQETQRRPRPRASSRSTSPGPAGQAQSDQRIGSTSTECDGCGATVQISWIPSASRPAYCAECRELLAVAV